MRLTLRLAARAARPPQALSLWGVFGLGFVTRPLGAIVFGARASRPACWLASGQAAGRQAEVALQKRVAGPKA
jgi:hypothetical protein